MASTGLLAELDISLLKLYKHNGLPISRCKVRLARCFAGGEKVATMFRLPVQVARTKDV